MRTGRYMTIHKVLARVRKRIHQENKNALMIVCGETGSGKSYTALKIAELLMKRFSIKYVVFSAEEFIQLVNSGKLKKGDVIIWDEAGVGIPAKEWWSISNKMINYVLQVFRKENLIVIFTTPSFTFIDASTRRLFHAYIETVRVDFKRKQTIVKWMRVQYNPRFGKDYYKYHRVVNSEGINVVKKLRFGLPSEQLIKDYEDKKIVFAANLYSDVEGELKDIREGKEKAHLRVDDMAKEVMEKKEMYTKMWGGKQTVDLILIMNTYDIGRWKAMQVKKKVESDLGY